MNIPQALALALEHHQAGRLAEAEALYRQILAAQPGHVDALHHLGVVALQVGRLEIARQCIGRAAELSPNDPAIHSNLGEAFRLSGRWEEAVASFRRALHLAPERPELRHNLGNALRQQGDALMKTGRRGEAVFAYREAVGCSPGSMEAWINLGFTLMEDGQLDGAAAAIRRALEISPGHAGAWNNLGAVLHRQRRREEAMAAYRRAIELQPDYAQAHNNLGLLLQTEGRFDEAVAACRRALEIKPDYADGWISLGMALAGQNEHEEAESCYRRGLELQPDLPEALSNLAATLSVLGRFAEAEAACRQALERQPGFPDAHNNLGTALAGQGHVEKAIEAYRRAIDLLPDYSLAQYNLGLYLLLSGDYAHGWPLHEARWGAYRYAPRRFSQPRWDGTPLAGQRVLIHAEQGLGDSIHFIRYAPLIVERGGEVVVECPRSLVELFRGVKGVSEVVADGEALPAFHLHIPMLSLPLVFQTTLETIPAEVPYLFADVERRKSWRARLVSEHTRLKVGLAWAGNPQNVPLRKRDVPLEKLAPLLAVEGVDFFSLQMDLARERPREFSGRDRIIDHTAHIHDFSDTAAFMTELDLIITVDTAVAHLAGALGQPVWTLLSFVADWRWVRAGERTPWYPTMRLFRQPAVADWEPVIGDVAKALRKRMMQKKPGS